jgi:hypothetical protein
MTDLMAYLPEQGTRYRGIEKNQAASVKAL